MNLQAIEESEARFKAYMQELTGVFGHKDRAGPFCGYCKGLLLETGRKSVEPLAAATSAGEDIVAASVSASFRGQFGMVRYGRVR
jgi:SRSO17 transposase